MPVMCETRSSCEHVESSGTNIMMRGPIVCQLCVRNRVVVNIRSLLVLIL